MDLVLIAGIQLNCKLNPELNQHQPMMELVSGAE